MTPNLVNDAARLATLKADIQADQVLAAFPDDPDGNSAIAAAYNVVGTSIVWRSSVTLDEIMQNGFDWTQVDNATVGQARIWEWLFNNTTKSINPSKLNVRLGIAECWKGNAQKLAVQAAVLAHCKRADRRAELLFAAADGDGTTGAPRTMAVEGILTYQEVQAARNS